MKFDVWSEGYVATGEHSPAICHRRNVEAANFQEACDQVFSARLRLRAQPARDESGRLVFTRILSEPKFHDCYDRDNLTFWGCKLFTNETEARMSFG